MRSCLQSALILINESVAGLVYESANYGALTFRTVALTAVKSDDDAADAADGDDDPSGAEGISVVAHRPAATAWKRAQCGSPTGSADLPTKWTSAVSASSTLLIAYPRPQMVRGSGANLTSLRNLGDTQVWANLNGLWEWEKSSTVYDITNLTDSPPFGKTLNRSILVPFPVESCLSGVSPRKLEDMAKSMWYRLVFDLENISNRTLLHFGAIDWQTKIYLNGVDLGNHSGGYDSFSFDVSEQVRAKGNELLLFVFDPSDDGIQPDGKQRFTAIDTPGGDKYTPSSGIWQTVWLESVPTTYIHSLKIDQAAKDAVVVVVSATGPPSTVFVSVLDGSLQVASGSGFLGQPITIKVPSPQLWSPDSPTLYDLKVTAGNDTVFSYFGLRTFTLAPKDPQTDASMRPFLNGKPIFAAGVLDQSFWPDGHYTAPTDEALESDLMAAKMVGFNMIRLHQKVNPERWYYHADRLGLLIYQDMVQKSRSHIPPEHATNDTVPLFVSDLKAMLVGKGNHPCIVQWTIWNEADCWGVFVDAPKPYDILGLTELVKQLDPTRLVDTNSGTGSFHGKKFPTYGVGDVLDIHSYPAPGDPRPSKTQYAMVGEFGGIGLFTQGKEWVPGQCAGYPGVSNITGDVAAATFVNFANQLKSRVDHISAYVYTQLTDVELECDGMWNYDRTKKFNTNQTRMIFNANQALIKAAVKSDDDAALCEKVRRPFHILVGVPRYSYMYFES